MTTPSTQVTVSSLLGDISQYVYNPAKIQTTMTAALSKILDGTIEIVDATNPFALAMECSACNTAAFAIEAAALTRRQYPAAATTQDDLYLHMSDTDYLNMFALPSTVTFTIVLQYEQLINSLVFDPITGVSQITIPRNSEFYAAGVVFSLQYPVNIRQLQHGGLQVVYDASQPSPLQTLDTNVIPFSIVQMPDGLKYMTFNVNIQQFDIVTVYNDVNATSGLKSQVTITDQFYYCRVYNQNTVTGLWTELVTTYTEQVYDPNTPTAVISVSGQVVTVEIPPVYAINNTVRGKIRIDVYETKGPLTMYMGNYSESDFSATWYYIDNNDATPAAAAINNINNVSVYSTDVSTGGRDALTFDEMRQRVISNSIGPQQIPITPAKIQNQLTDDDYTIVKYIDEITGRSFWATKPLPSPTDLNPEVTNNVYTAANASMLSLLMSVDEGSTAYGCTVHATGMTITSAALFNTNNGISSLVTSAAYSQLLSLPLIQQADALNQAAYFYTPFYYVLDVSTDVFDVRPYSLDNPTINGRSFVQENATTGLQVSIGSTFGIVKTSTGYQITLTTASNSAYQALPDSSVFCQLAFKTSDGMNTAYMLGVQQARQNNQGERTFVFSISTTYDLDSTHALDLPDFVINGQAITPRCDLLQDFQVLFGTSTTMPSTYQSSTIDSMLGAFQLPVSAVGLTYETLTIQIGSFLDNLWCNYRSFAAQIPYQTYTQDVPAVYANDVYQQDPNTGTGFSVVNGVLTWTKLHSRGDPILDSDGNPTFVHRAGDPVLDIETGLPIAQTNYQTQLQREIDIFAINAVYRFANDPITTAYVQFVYQSLLAWITEDLVTLNQSTLEQTQIYFYPSVSQGTVTVLIENGVAAAISAAQSLDVVLYVPTETNNNPNLLASLTSSTIQNIGSYLAVNSTVSVSELQSQLRGVYGKDVVDVKISGFGGSSNYTVLTIQNSSTKLSINKILQVQANNQMSVQEDVRVTFIVHDTN